MNSSVKNLPAHPGKVLREQMRGNNKTIAESAELPGAPTSQFSRVFTGKMRLAATEPNGRKKAFQEFTEFLTTPYIRFTMTLWHNVASPA